MSAGFSISSLNPAQRDAVRAIHGPVLILAGAGTGKTRTVTCRVAAMLDQGIKPENILAVTFTNKAASEMRERVSGMVKRKAAKLITISTFHSLCVKVLRADIERIGYKSNFSIFTDSDQMGLMRQLIVRMGGKKEKIEPRDILSSLSRAKNSGLGIESIEDDLHSSISSAYTREIKSQNAVDFDDLLILAEKILREFPDAREAWRRKFQFITVDEFQDTNGLQMSLLSQLVGPKHNICVVGDDDQSIYGWRGAEISNILEFEKFFPNPKIIKLEENYRCTRPILDAANSLIRHNIGRRDKTLRTNKLGGEPVMVVSMPGDNEEAEFIADEISTQRRRENRRWEDFAILFRANTQSRALEQALRSAKIPYRMIGAQSFYDRREIKDLLAYLTIFSNPDSDIHLLRIINTPPRAIGQSTVIVATDWSREHHESVWQAIKDEALLEQFSTRTEASLSEFSSLIEKYHVQFAAGTTPFGDIFKAFIDEIGFEDFVKRSSKTEVESDNRLNGINDFMRSLREFWSPGKSLREFLDNVSLNDEKEDKDIEDKIGTTLITLHASKGLEFPIVYLVGLEEGVLPHKRSIEEGTRDEERRLLYVGITRAQEKLTMTYCSSRTRYGDKMACRQSSFFQEISPELLQFEHYDDLMSRELSEEETDELFADWRNELLNGNEL